MNIIIIIFNMMKVISNIPKELNTMLNKVVEKQMSNRSVIVRLAIREYCEKILGEQK